MVLINKEPHPSETYNDTDGDLCNLFRLIRDPDGVVHLWWELVNTPVARAEFGDAIRAAKFSPESPVKRAAKFVIRCRQRFGGGMSGTARTDTDRSWATARGFARDMNDTVSRWLSAMNDLPLVHRRLSTVVVDSQDAVRCVNQWDSPSTLFYVDPPYVGTEDYYQGGFGREDHTRLAAALNAASGRAVVSYYECAEVNALYPETRWHRLRVQTHASASGHAKRDPNAAPGKVKECQKRTELILLNFEEATRKRLA